MKILCALLLFVSFSAPDTATVEGPLFSSNPAKAGSPVGVYGRVINTSDKRRRFTTAFSITSDCDDRTYAVAGPSPNLDAGRGVFISTSWNIPPDACAGQYTVSITVESGNQELASESAVLVVD